MKTLDDMHEGIGNGKIYLGSMHCVNYCKKRENDKSASLWHYNCTIVAKYTNSVLIFL